MKRFLIVTFFVAAFAAAVLLTLFVKTVTANADIAAGNLAYATQDYETALQHYARAQSQASGYVEPVYNTANTYYRQNVLDKAQQTLEQALARPRHAMAESVHFNLGNVAYNTQQFDVAIAQYEAALRLQPDDYDAKYNLELALQQKQQQDQQQNQDQQNQDQQNQDQQNQDQQNQDQQNQDQQNQDQQNQDQQNQDQQNQNQQNQQEQQPGEQQDQPQGQQGDQQQPDQQNGQPAGVRPQQGLTPEQARQLLAVIGGNSQTLMEKLQQIVIVPGGKPDKDW